MTEVKEQFKEAASKQTTTLGWKFIFDKYDDDGSGELDIDEFRQCVRHECKLTQEECSDDDVVELFCIVDADESGAIDATELRTFLTTDLEAASMTFAPFMASDPAYLQAALEQIEADHGSVETYLLEALDVSEADLAAMRRELLE